RWFNVGGRRGTSPVVVIGSTAESIGMAEAAGTSRMAEMAGMAGARGAPRAAEVAEVAPIATPASPTAGPTWWRELVAGPVLALQFLTAVPIRLAVPATPRHFGRALACFPLVGALLGLALGGLDAALLRALSASV